MLSQVSWGSSSKHSGDAPQLKGARCFPYYELKNFTDNFSERNEIGAGGYGKVWIVSNSIACFICLHGGGGASGMASPAIRPMEAGLSL